MKLAIIGGSLFSHIHGLEHVNKKHIKTPYGEPSACPVCGNVGDLEVVFINRHGVDHNLAPHQINYRANMFALKMLDVTHVIAVAAVGGITQNMPPLKCVVPDQIIDYSYGRKHTFNDASEDGVKHIDFSYPYDEDVRQRLIKAADESGVECETRATYGATQGPRLETIAEIKRMKQDGCDIVGMTGMPEAALARELEINYANLSLVVNWAAGVEKMVEDDSRHQIISMDEIKQLITEGNSIVERVVSMTMATINE